MSQRSVRRLMTMLGLSLGLLLSQEGMTGDVIPKATFGASSAIEFLRDEQPFLFSDSGSRLNDYVRIPDQVMATPVALWSDSAAAASDMKDGNGFDEAGISFGTQRQNDPWLMTLVGAGLIVLQLRRKQKSLQQGMLLPN